MPCALLLQFVNLFLQVDYVEGEFLDFPEQEGVHLANVDTVVLDLFGGGDVWDKQKSAFRTIVFFLFLR